MRREKALYLISAIVMVCVMLSSFGRSISIDKRGIVHAMGIDECDDGYRVSLQIFQPGGGGADTAVDVTKPNVTPAVCEGRTVSDALAKAKSSTGKELFFGHLQLICLGRGTPLDDPDDLFAFALGDKNISPSANVCMAENTAEELITISVGITEEETSAEALTRLLEVSREYSDTTGCDLIDILSAEQVPTIPVLRVKSSDTDSGEGSTEVSSVIELAGTSAGSGGTMLDTKEALAAAMLSGKADKGHIVSEISAGSVTSSLDSFSIKRDIDIKDGRLVVTSGIKLTAAPDRVLDSSQCAELSNAISAELEKNCLELQRKMYSEGRDIFGTQKLIKHIMPELWLKYSSSPESLLKAAVPVTEVEVRVV